MACPGLQELLEIIAHIFKHKIEYLPLKNDFLQFHYIRMLQSLEYGDLSNGSRRHSIFFILKPNLLQSHDLGRVRHELTSPV